MKMAMAMKFCKSHTHFQIDPDAHKIIKIKGLPSPAVFMIRMQARLPQEQDPAHIMAWPNILAADASWVQGSLITRLQGCDVRIAGIS